MFRKDASAVGYVRSTSRRRLWPSNMAVFLMQAPTMLSAPGGTATLGCAENYLDSKENCRRDPGPSGDRPHAAFARAGVEERGICFHGKGRKRKAFGLVFLRLH